MKSYFVLRDNHESGPFTQYELKQFGLAPDDLIWVESESTSWKYPSEFSELRQLAKAGIKKPFPAPLKQPSAATKEPADASVDAYWQAIANKSLYSTKAADEDWDSGTSKDESFLHAIKKQKRKFIAFDTSLFGLGVLLVSTMLCAFVVKKMVDHFEFGSTVSAEAIEINQALPISTGSHTARADITPSLTPLTMGATTVNTDSAAVQAAQKTTPAVQNAIQAKQAITETQEGTLTSVDNATVKTEGIAAPETKEEPVTTQKEEKPAATPAVNRAPSLQLSASDYKVGLFGGISDLEITISNPSSQRVNRATVEVDILKPNGSVLKTETLSVENIAPGSAKKVAVPSSSRGVKVRYRVVNVIADDSKVAVNDI